MNKNNTKTIIPFNNRSPFSEYLQKAQQFIAQNRIDLTAQNKQKIIYANCPKEHIPPTNSINAKHGIILIHGLLDSCCCMDSLFHYFSIKDFYVRTILLPGHGTKPEDLLHTKMEEWVQTCRFAITDLKTKVKHLTVIGLSTGAALALYLQKENNIDSLICFAPAIKIKTPMAKWVTHFSKCGYLFPWINKQQEKDYAKYLSLPFNAVLQLQRLINKNTLYFKTQPLTIPNYTILTTDDETISTKAAIEFHQKNTNNKSQLLVFSNEDNKHRDPRALYINSCLPEKNILNFSHVSLTNAPNHPHYGENGDYPQNKQQLGKYLGALTPSNIRDYHLQRLLYNPHFTLMLNHIDKFLQTVRPI